MTIRTDAAAVETAYRTHRRFDRAARLFGEPGLDRLMHARVLVFGMGGVGSFAAESLARSAVGELVLVDFDEVCITNVNRQLHALKGTVGRQKVDVMAERIKLIHPAGKVRAVPEFYNAESSERLLETCDFVVDAIDNVTAKVHLIATCMRRGIPLVSSMGAAARLDPTRVRTADLAQTHTDPLARHVRKLLKQHHGIQETELGVTAVFSDEPSIDPNELHYDKGEGFRCVCPSGDNGLHSCDKRSRIEGSASFVTGTFGLTCASVVVRTLIGR
ncbi:MAG TPA: tRNA threonylcarbamoyladenosine dehydratase [Polyangiales bacterium]|nr:tRNA threonylcarbamoyladenosine dehydratase [Polyangiales bacterium]